MNSEERQNDPNEILNQIKNELRGLNENLEKQNQRISRLESIAQLEENPADSFSVPSQVMSPPPPPPPTTETSPDEYIMPETSKLPSNEAFEERVGGKLFARIGIIALVLGISFFLKYAFDNNWIGETGRVIMGIIAGIVLLGIGEKTIRKYPAYGQLISGGGIAVLYLSIFAAFNFYHLISQFPAALFMVLITAIGVTLSIRYDSMPLIIWAIIGGFSTPFLINSGENQLFSLFSYVLLLDLAILSVSIFKKWREVNILGFIGTSIIFLSWIASHYTKEQLIPTMFFATLFFLVYSLSSLIYNLIWKEKSSGTEQSLTLLSAVSYFFVSFALLNGDYHEFMGFFACFLALYYLIWAYSVRQITPEDDNLYNFLALLTIGFITLAIPIQFHGNVITLGWIIEALILFFIGIKTRVELIKILSIVVYALVVFRLFFLDSQMEMNQPLFLLNERFFTFFLATAASYFGAFLFLSQASDDTEKNKFATIKQYVAILIIMANVFTIFSVSQEILGYYGRQISEIQTKKMSTIDRYYSDRSDRSQFQNRSILPDGYPADYQNDIEAVDKLKNRRDISLSLFWLVYAMAVLAVGFWKKYKAVRLGGILLLLLSILKLFFYDLWSLGTLYRIISSISLGVVLLLISFAYQKYKDKLKEIIE
jgi:uncharacterized membrane protein